MLHSQSSDIVTHPGFASSEEAGMKLAKLLRYYNGRDDTAILCLSEAAATLTAVLADNLHLSHSTFTIRQLMSPSAPGLSLGAVGAVGGQWWNENYGVGLVKNEEIIRSAHISQADLDALIQEQTNHVLSTLPNPADASQPAASQPAALPSTVLLVDTGVNSTTTIRSAVKLLRTAGYEGKIVLACAVIGADAKQILFREVGEVVALASPKNIGSPDKWLEFLLPSPTPPSGDVRLSANNAIQV